MHLGDDRGRRDRRRERVAVNDRELGQADAGDANRVDEEDVGRGRERHDGAAASPRRLARRMSSASMSRAATTPTPTASARRADLAVRAARAPPASSFLESSRPGQDAPGGRITAAATTGPASEPRPASSTPAMRENPRRESSDSTRVRLAQPTQLREECGERVGSHVLEDGPTSWSVCFSSMRAALPLRSAQVVQLGAAHGALALHLDLVDDRRVEREDALDADRRPRSCAR